MYKIKLFRNMSGLVAGQSLKQMVTNKDWWKGVFGNMFSTMLGIGLTIGVGALVEHHNDKKLAREMMFSIVKTCEDNGEVVAKYDSIFNEQIEAVKWTLKTYQSTDKFENIKSQEQADSLVLCLNKFLHVHIFEFTDPQMDKSFYSAQTMHQIGNQVVYAEFSRFVQMDRETYDKIQTLLEQWKDLVIYIQNKIYIDGVEDEDFFRQLVEEHKMSDFYYRLGLASLNNDVAEYKHEAKTMLKNMDATEEEYEEYKAEITKGHKTHNVTFAKGKIKENKNSTKAKKQK